jgi:hypothetical protein
MMLTEADRSRLAAFSSRWPLPANCLEEIAALILATRAEANADTAFEAHAKQIYRDMTARKETEQQR